MEVIVMKIERKEGGAVVTGPVRAGIGPFTGDGLDEALGLAIGLRPTGFGKAMLEAELLAGLSEEFGAISGAAIGEDAQDGDAMVLVEGDGLVKGGEDALGFFVWKEGGEGEAGMLIDGDVKRFDADPRVAHGAITGGTDAWRLEAAQLLDVEVEKITGRIAFVADEGRFWRFEGGEPVEPMAAQDAGKRGRGNAKDAADLRAGTALAAQGEDLSFEIRGSLARRTKRSRRAVVETLGEAGEFGAGKPAADGFFADAQGGGGVAQRAAGKRVTESHLGSRQRGQSGISVHVVRAEERGVECSSTTSLPNPFPADNLLKHHS